MRRIAFLLPIVVVVVAACGSGTSPTTTAESTGSVATTASSSPATAAPSTAASTQDTEPPTFADVLAVWNAGGTRDVATVYASDGRVFDVEAVAASGIAEIGQSASTSRGAGNLITLITPPVTVVEAGGGVRYEFAAVESHRPADSAEGLEVVVLKWVGDLVSSQWWLPVPDAARGTYRLEDSPDAVALVERMTQAWDAGDTSAAEDVYAAGVRVHWFGESVSDGIEELLATIGEAHGIGNAYRSFTTPAAIVETESGRTFVVAVTNVTGVAHPDGSVVVNVSEVGEGRIAVWSVFFTENLPAN